MLVAGIASKNYHYLLCVTFFSCFPSVYLQRYTFRKSTQPADSLHIPDQRRLLCSRLRLPGMTQDYRFRFACFHVFRSQLLHTVLSGVTFVFSLLLQHILTFTVWFVSAADIAAHTHTRSTDRHTHSCGLSQRHLLIHTRRLTNIFRQLAFQVTLPLLWRAIVSVCLVSGVCG